MSDKPAGPDLTLHGCHICGVYGMYGFGHSEVRWYCARHHGHGKAWWNSMRGSNGGQPAAPSGGMF